MGNCLSIYLKEEQLMIKYEAAKKVQVVGFSFVFLLFFFFALSLSAATKRKKKKER